jgi:hypothetical protein
MREISASELRALSIDLNAELQRLNRLEQEIQMVQSEIQRDPDRANLFYEVQALKLHHFYTERLLILMGKQEK